MLLASAAVVTADEAPAQSPATQPAAVQAEPVAPPPGIALQPPINSTLEIRIARRPWLLERLSKPKTEPSIKMDPPRPPAEIPDPPSMSRIPNGEPPGTGIWTRRGTSPLTPMESARQSPPLKQPSTPVRDSSTSPETELRRLDVKADAQGTPRSAVEISGDGPTKTKPAEANAEESLENLLRDAKGEKVPGAARPDEMANDGPARKDRPEVRDLIIESDGAPIENDEAGQETIANDSARETNADLADANETGSEQEETTSRQASQFVGSESDKVIDLDYVGYPRAQVRMTRTMQHMRGSLRNCLRYYYARPEIANERSNWGMMHSIMVYGADTKIRVGSNLHSAIAWIAGNNACRGQRILIQQDGRITARSGVGLQGHQAQLLAILSLCNVPQNYPLYADDERFTVKDLVESEMLGCKSGEELTFTLIGLSHYLDTNAAWKNADGEIWDFERLIREELAQPIVGAACGGTHRLMGFAHALRKRRAEGRPMTGQWKRAEHYTRDFIAYAYRLQNRDGSMTTDWFEGREDNGDVDRKIQTTGHIVEWLLTVTPDSHLHDPRLVNAVRFLLKAMSEEPDRDWKIGPKGHALRSLAMYYERAYRGGTAWQSRNMASAKPSSRR